MKKFAAFTLYMRKLRCERGKIGEVHVSCEIWCIIPLLLGVIFYWHSVSNSWLQLMRKKERKRKKNWIHHKWRLLIFLTTCWSQVGDEVSALLAPSPCCIRIITCPSSCKTIANSGWHHLAASLFTLLISDTLSCSRYHTWWSLGDFDSKISNFTRTMMSQVPQVPTHSLSQSHFFFLFF